LLPLIACGLSLIHLSVHAIQQAHESRRGGYHLLNGAAHVPRGLNSVDTLGAEEDVGDEDARTTLIKVATHDPDAPVADINRPRAAFTLNVVELLCLLGQVGVNLGWLSLYPDSGHVRRAAIGNAAVSLYVTALVSMRLHFHNADRNPLPKLWNHTASLYFVQWFSTVFFFRSVIIHPPSQGMQGLIVAKFVLVTILTIIALTTRIGNRTVLLVREGDIAPSREPLASLLSIGTFAWVDAIVYKGWKKPLEIEDVWNLLPTEKPMVILASFRRYTRTTGLALHLIKWFKYDLLYQQVWAAISALFSFAPTLLLKAILEYVEDPEATPKSTAWLYVVLLFVCTCIVAVADGQALWRGRKICIKLRSIMIGEIYAKTLRRKAASSGDTDMNASSTQTDEETKNYLKLIYRKFFGKKKQAPEVQTDGANDAEEKSADTQVNSGTIINLMSVDSFRVSEISAYWHFLIPSVPIQLVVAIYLLFLFLGWSAIAGICVMVAVLPLNMFYSNRFSYAHKRIMSATDGRIHTTNEVLQNVRIIKFFAWEERFASNIHDKRVVELAAVRYRFTLWACAAVTWFGVPMIITAFSFLLYTLVEKKPLVPSVAFTALSLFGLLRFPLDRLADMLAHVLESRVSVARVEKFLDEEETGKYDQLLPTSQGDSEYIGFKNATCSWGPKDESSTSDSQAFRILNMDVEFKKGGLNIVAGPTGSGKTSLLMALLGEMTLIDGSVHLPGGYDRTTLKPGQDGLTESVAYCAQQAWLVNDTIKQNIIFASPYDEQRYRDVIEACALKRDMEVLDAGDSTLVGEKGIVVSGGQKQRISLARALYSNARYILLDDVLSAVDSHTAQHIFERCIQGPLLANRTCILVTHNIALCVPEADHVVALANGKIAGQGTADKMMSSGLLGEEFSKSQPNSRPATRGHSRQTSLVELNGKILGADGKQNGQVPEEDVKPKKQQDEVKDASTRTEGKAEGAVGWAVIKLYLTSLGPWYFWVLILIGFVLENITNVATNVWIREWANSYQTRSVRVFAEDNSTQQQGYLAAWIAPVRSLHLNSGASAAVNIQSASPSEVDVPYYLGIYILLSLTYILVCLFRLGTMFRGSLNASKSLHDRVLDSVLRSKFKFFDTTPLGQIMNRFSKDLQAVDQDVAPVSAGLLQCMFSIVSIVALISVITPMFLIAGALLTVVYIAVGAFYIHSSRDLKRVESTQRSPLYQQFGETLSGVTTIRAYGDERRFIDDNSRRINTYNRPYIYLWAANRWLALRVDVAGALVSFFAAAFIVISVGSIDAGAAGLSLTYSLGFNKDILWLVRLYTENEQNMNHVERLKNFLEVEQEAPAHIPEMQPTGTWPSKGAVRFEKYTARYRADLDPVLKDLSINIQAEEKVGIVGRTGAGKSSLALALFRGLEAESGKIFIDNVDISQIGLQDLRENLTIVPQDPTLFTGTIRSNVDPFNLFTDDEIFTALRRVHLVGRTASEPATNPTAQGNTRPDEFPASTASAIDESAVEGIDPAAATADLSAPAPLRRSSLSVPRTTAEEAHNTLNKVLTNTRENANVFLNLASPVAESGTNLSQGQRQLLCLARALLKAPRVLLMDEATASIDYATDAKIQDTLRELKGSTIITIAHRLQTIVDYDKVLVLDKGEVAEFGAPWDLIAKDGGMFRGMCEMSGDFDTLKDLAKKAEGKTRLVDIEE
jgi:ABC-type multidrug transport system fused ATPase/permease subunit